MEYSLFGMNRKQLLELMPNQSAFRSKQLFEYLYMRRTERPESLDDCTVLSLELRKSFSLPLFSTTLDCVLSNNEDAIKYRILLSTGEAIEAVVLIDPLSGRRTACLSSQAGCKMGCRFCRTATLGFNRNLTAGEILEQLKWIEFNSGEVNNVVFMGMGEPLDNLENVINAISILTDDKGFRIGRRRITISTCGLPKAILALAEAQLGVRLAVSLNSAFSAQRQELMPIEKKFSLSELKKSLISYQKQCGGKRITIEYVMMHKLNLSCAHVEAICQFVKGLKVLINVIPLNGGEEIPFKVPSESECIQFEKQLLQAGLTVTRRRSKGQDILGACGQLAAQKK